MKKNMEIENEKTYLLEDIHVYMPNVIMFPNEKAFHIIVDEEIENSPYYIKVLTKRGLMEINRSQLEESEFVHFSYMELLSIYNSIINIQNLNCIRIPIKNEYSEDELSNADIGFEIESKILVPTIAHEFKNKVKKHK